MQTPIPRRRSREAHDLHAGQTPPLNPLIWAPASQEREFLSYTCVECGKRMATWESFIDHRKESRIDSCSPEKRTIPTLQPGILRVALGEEEPMEEVAAA